MKALDDITGEILDAALKLHQALGPGLLESVYEAVLARDLARRGLKVERQRTVPFEFDGLLFDEGLKVDLLVEDTVVVELKSVETLAPVHSKQVLTYLRLLKLPVGLLINFGAPTLKEGLHRIVNHLPPSASPRLRVNQEAQSAVNDGLSSASPRLRVSQEAQSAVNEGLSSASPRLRVSQEPPGTANDGLSSASPRLRVSQEAQSAANEGLSSASPRLRVSQEPHP